jgi:hypothetical protein
VEPYESLGVPGQLVVTHDERLGYAIAHMDKDDLPLVSGPEYTDRQRSGVRIDAPGRVHRLVHLDFPLALIKGLSARLPRRATGAGRTW